MLSKNVICKIKEEAENNKELFLALHDSGHPAYQIMQFKIERFWNLREELPIKYHLTKAQVETALELVNKIWNQK